MGGARLTLAYFHGKKYNEEKEVFFENADIFIFPTLNEAFGLVLLEAMKHALPCIATDEGGISDIVDDGKTGFIVSKRNANILADKIEYLLIHPEERMRMGKLGYKKFNDKFTVRKFEELMADILNDCLEG